MNLTRLQTFVEVVRHGTLARAADALSFTPSAVSQQMAKLEAEIGAPLLAREAGAVGLTEAGRLLHEHALGILGAVWEARDELESLQARQVKRLRIGACPLAAGAVLPRAVRLLRRRLPGADLVLEEADGATTERAVREGRLQVGVWVAVAEAAATPAGPCDVVLRRAPLQVALAADHPLARRRELDVDALAACTLLGDTDSPEARAYAERFGGARRMAHARVGSVRGLLALVAAGEGFTLLPEPAADPLPAGVVLRPLAGAPEWELRAARAAHEVLSVGTLAVLDALRAATGPRDAITINAAA